jgi:hypothetical protein
MSRIVSGDLGRFNIILIEIGSADFYAANRPGADDFCTTKRTKATKVSDH